jgi:hypothetical protein
MLICHVKFRMKYVYYFVEPSYGKYDFLRKLCIYTKRPNLL